MASSEKNLELNCDDFKCIEDPVVGELGGGAQSVVRLTLHTTLGPVAVKCFSVTGGPPDRRRLESKIVRELQIVQKAANQFIVQTHGWVKWSKAMGLVMEYLPVGSIRQFTVDSIAKLTPKVILRMAHEIACAIAYMHNLPGDHRVVHGDLKPENVLLTKDLHCKVGDFGSAELSAFTGAATLTGPKREKPSMTLAYAAPEKLKKLNIKPKKEQDTYSFGMLLYVLLTGSAPYTQTSHEIAFVVSIKQGERPDTEEIDELKEAASTDDKQIIEVLESIMKKCWQQDPSERPNMIEVRDQLQELRDQQSNVDTLKEVAQVLEAMSLSPPMAKEQRLVPLHQFSPINGEFARGGIVYNIYNLPNVQQAAINCDGVEFEQDASGIAAPGELPENNSAMDEVFKVQDAFSTSEPTDPSTYSTEPVKSTQQPASQQRPVPSLRRSHGERKKSSTSQVSEFGDDDDAISVFETTGSSTNSAPSGDHSEMRESNSPKEPELNDDVTTSTSETVGSSTSSDSPVKSMQQSASQQIPEPSLRRFHSEMNESSTSQVSEFDDDDDDDDDDDAISVFKRAGSSTSSAPSVKFMQQSASQQIPEPSLRRYNSEINESSSSKVIEFDDEDDGDGEDEDDDDDAISTFERTGSSTSSAQSGNVAVTRSSEKKPTLDEVFEALVDGTGNSRRRNKNVKKSSTSNAPSFRSFFKKKQSFKKSDLSASSGQTWLPSNVQPAPDFLKHYKVSLQNQKYEEAKTMATTITSMIEDNIDATAEDVKDFGIQLREKKLFLESIAIFDAASAMFEKLGKTEENLQLIRICVGEMTFTNIAMIGDDASTKGIVKNFVIPLMREKLRHMEDTSLVTEQFKCLQVCWVLHDIEYSEYLVDEWKESEKTLRSALTRMEDAFQADALNLNVYGTLLHSLGVVCDRMSRFEKAASFYKQAIGTFKAATDYSDEELRKKHIAKSENNLKIVEQKMK